MQTQWLALGGINDTILQNYITLSEPYHPYHLHKNISNLSRMLFTALSRFRRPVLPHFLATTDGVRISDIARYCNANSFTVVPTH